MASICKRKDGTWCAAIVHGVNDNGKPKRKYLYGKTKKEVAEKVRQYTTDIYEYGKALSDDRISLQEWTYKHLFTNLRQTLSVATFENYMCNYNVHIKGSVIGQLSIKDLVQMDLQHYFNQKVYLSNGTMRKIYNLLNSSFQGAIANNLIRINPLTSVRLPKSTKDDKTMEVMSVYEQKKYMNECENAYHGLLCLTALATGLRLGEVRALRWKNVDLNNCIITIRENVVYSRVYDAHGNYETKETVKEPKTKSGIRLIPLPNFIAAKLRTHKVASKYSGDADKVFCTSSGKFLGESNIRRTHYAICNKAGIRPLNFHALRHTFATRMVEASVDYKVLQEILGHKDIKVTMNRYAHVTQDTKKAAIAAQDNLYQEYGL